MIVTVSSKIFIGMKIFWCECVVLRSEALVTESISGVTGVIMRSLIITTNITSSRVLRARYWSLSWIFTVVTCRF